MAVVAAVVVVVVGIAVVVIGGTAVVLVGATVVLVNVVVAAVVVVGIAVVAAVVVVWIAVVAAVVVVAAGIAVPLICGTERMIICTPGVFPAPFVPKIPVVSLCFTATDTSVTLALIHILVVRRVGLCLFHS